MDEAIKELYRNGALVTASAYFPSISLTLTNEIIEESPNLIEGIISGDDLKFGACVVSQFSFTVDSVSVDLSGLEFEYKHIVGGYTVPLGIYKVDSAVKQDDLIFKDVTAYDRMKKVDIDVAAWYNSLTFPTTLAAFRASFLAYVGLTQDTSKLPLPNDSMTVERTIDPSQISGRVVLEACEEINGAFGHINRYGEFTHIILKEMHNDYPQNDYPKHDYPKQEPYDEYVAQSAYREIQFEEYRAQPIDKLIVRQEENDIGAIVGTGTNAYIIQGNFLVYGKGAAELETIAKNAYINIRDRGYQPYTATQIGLPYIEVGDFVKYTIDNTSLVGYIFERTLTGIQALQDTYTAKGSEQLEQNFGVNNEIIQLLGKTATIQKSVEQVCVAVTDLDLQLTGEINVLAGQVVLKVDTNGNVGYVELTGDPDTDMTTLELKADNISLEGLVTVNGNFKVLADGTIEAVNARFSGTITGSTITGSAMKVSGEGYIESTDWNGTSYGVDFNETRLASGTFISRKTRYFSGGGNSYSSEGTIEGGAIDFPSINGDFLYANGSPVLSAANFLNFFIDIKDTMTYLPVNHSHGSAYGSFVSMDGKTVTVSGGIIASIA